VKPAADIPDIGRFAIVSDPQGALFIAFTPLPMPGPGPSDKPGLGDFQWHELMTTDAQRAWDFYQKLFGWQKTDAMEMGPGQTYQMFAPPGRPSVGGMFNKPGPAQWLSYVIVKDAKAAAKTIEASGGKVINGPMEVPGGDWITAGIDPQGVMFAVHSKKQAAAAQPAKLAKPASATKTSKPARKAKPARRAAKKTVKPSKKRKAAKSAKKKKTTARKRR
jgi:predicted enzyme related to lactoylglutathione lyase